MPGLPLYFESLDSFRATVSLSLAASWQRHHCTPHRCPPSLPESRLSSIPASLSHAENPTVLVGARGVPHCEAVHLRFPWGAQACWRLSVVRVTMLAMDPSLIYLDT